MKITKHLILKVDSEVLMDSYYKKWPNICILPPDDHTNQPDIYLFDRSVCKIPESELWRRYQSFYLIDVEKAVSSGRECLSQLEKHSDAKLISMAKDDKNLIHSISYVLASRGIADKFEIEPTDTEGHSYDITATINNKTVTAFSTIYNPMSYERTIVLAYLHSL